MSNIGGNIEDKFRDAFGQWEADHSSAEMQQAWQKVSQHIPGSPVQHAPTNHPGSSIAGKTGLAKIGMGAGKLIGLSLAAGLAITAVALLYFPGAKEQRREGNAKGFVSDSPRRTNKGQNVETFEKTSRNNGDKSGLSKTYFHTSLQNNTPAQKIAVNQQSNQSTNPLITQSTNPPTNQSTNPPSTIQPTNPPIHQSPIQDTTICLANTYRIYSDNRNLLVEWGDGTKSLAANDNGYYEHNYRTAAAYDLKISEGSQFSSRKVIVRNSPASHFTALESNGKNYKFNNLSQGANRYSWDFGDNSGASSNFDPEHNYEDTGWYTVKLAAFASGGCSENFSMQIHAGNSNSYSIPNVFTPNGDGKNDEFDITMSGETYFELNIQDMNSRQVFSSNDKSHKWQGNDLNGNPCKNGTYIYILKFQFPGEPLAEKWGMITLNR